MSGRGQVRARCGRGRRLGPTGRAVRRLGAPWRLDDGRRRGCSRAQRRAFVAWLVVLALISHLGALGTMRPPRLASVEGASATAAAAAVDSHRGGPAEPGHHGPGESPGEGRGGLGHHCTICQTLQDGLTLPPPQGVPQVFRVDDPAGFPGRPAVARPLIFLAGGGPRGPPSTSS